MRINFILIVVSNLKNKCVCIGDTMCDREVDINNVIQKLRRNTATLGNCMYAYIIESLIFKNSHCSNTLEHKTDVTKAYPHMEECSSPMLALPTQGCLSYARYITRSAEVLIIDDS